ncbi:MAG: tetratricopeptide repeat protein [Geminicoccaceae bacterium]
MTSGSVVMPRRLRLGGTLLAVLITACAGEAPPTSRGVAGVGAGHVTIESASVGDSYFGDYLAGNFALNTGQLEEASVFFENALAKHPDNLDLLSQLNVLSLASGRFDAALDQARRLVKLDPQAEEARLLLALADARAGDFAAARRHLAGLGHDGIAGLTAPFLDAWATFGEGGAGALDQALARVAQGEALGALNGYHSAMLLDLGGRLGEATTTLESAMPDTGPAPARMVQAYTSMLARGGDLEAAKELVQAQLADGRDRSVLQDVLADLEAGRAPPRPFDDALGGMADALLGIAEALHQEGGSAHAVVYARLAAFLRPELGDASILIGDIMTDRGNLDGAIEAYAAVPASSPMSYPAKLRMARALHAEGKPDAAFKLLDELAAAEPQRTDALVQLGDLLRRDEKYAEAEVAYSRAIERLGEPERENWSLLYARGITYERTKRWKQAEADFLEALELEPEQPFVLNYLGYSWVDMGKNLNKAKGMLNRAVELRPNDGFIVDSVGWVDYRLGDYKGAVEHLERAVELEPGDPVINDHLGDAYWRVGREREARFQWQRALTLDPEKDAMAAIEQKLKSGLPEPASSPGRT